MVGGYEGRDSAADRAPPGRTPRPGSEWTRRLAFALVLVAASCGVAVGAVAAVDSLEPIDGVVPQDLDGDGTYRDLNANDRIDYNDVVTFYVYMSDPAVTDHVSAYDYNANGRIDYNDVVTLYHGGEPPDAAMTAPANATVGDPVTFDAGPSADEGRIVAYAWSFGDGTAATGENVSHAFDRPGTYAVRLTVTDDDGTTANVTRAVTVEPAGDGSVGGPDGERVVGYYTSWARYERGYEPGDVPLDRLTHLHYAFLDVRADGSVVFGDAWADEQNLQRFRNRSEAHPNTTMMLSIGGWSYSGEFSEAAATERRRERFAETAIAKMRTYGFDGVDVDWEYPGGGGQAGNTVRPGDPHNFTLLIERLRTELDAAEEADGREYSLSVAVSGNPETADPLEVERFADDVDYVTVMTYDYNGAWGSETDHNAPLYVPPDDPDGEDALSVNRSMAYWADRPIADEKLSMGVPFYGRGYANVDSDADGLHDPFQGTPSGTYGSSGVYEYWDLRRNLNRSSEFRYHWDDEAKVPYLYSPSRDVFVSYDNRRSVAVKAEYVEQRGYGGVTVWALSHDKGGVLLERLGEAFEDGESKTRAERFEPS